MDPISEVGKGLSQEYFELISSPVPLLYDLEMRQAWKDVDCVHLSGACAVGSLKIVCHHDEGLHYCTRLANIAVALGILNTCIQLKLSDLLQ